MEEGRLVLLAAPLDAASLSRDAQFILAVDGDPTACWIGDPPAPSRGTRHHSTWAGRSGSVTPWGDSRHCGGTAEIGWTWCCLTNAAPDEHVIECALRALGYECSAAEPGREPHTLPLTRGLSERVLCNRVGHAGLDQREPCAAERPQRPGVVLRIAAPRPDCHVSARRSGLAVSASRAYGLTGIAADEQFMDAASPPGRRVLAAAPGRSTPTALSGITWFCFRSVV